MYKTVFFRNNNGSLTTQLAKRLKFLDISFVFTNSPEAKGKIESIHQVWQDRLPACAAREGITRDTPLEDINENLACLVDFHNGLAKHRDFGDVPLRAWQKAIDEGRCKIRQPPRDGWWELIWSTWRHCTIGPRGRLVIGGALCPTECSNGTRAWMCKHLDGMVSLVMNKPEKDVLPKVVFTNNPRVDRR